MKILDILNRHLTFSVSLRRPFSDTNSRFPGRFYQFPIWQDLNRRLFILCHHHNPFEISIDPSRYKG
jgi:hypothetical protein